MRFAFLLLWAAAVPLAAQQCTFSLNPSTRSVPAAPFDGSFTVLASASSCPRTAVSDSDWLTVSFGTPGTGDGTVGYHAAANTTASARSGNITVGNARFTLTQAGADCSLSLSPLSAQLPRSAGRGSLMVTSNCARTAVGSSSWRH